MLQILPEVRASCQHLNGIDEALCVMSLAIAGGGNPIIYGPPGEAKTDMIGSILGCLGTGMTVYQKTMTAESSVEDLLGPKNHKALLDPKKGGSITDHLTEFGFLHRDVAWLKEGLSAPEQTLAALRDIMEDKKLSNGTQTVACDTYLYIIDTNVPPAQVSERGEEFRALIERFNLQYQMPSNSTAALLTAAWKSQARGKQVSSKLERDKIKALRDSTASMEIGDDVISEAAAILAGSCTSKGGRANPRLFVKMIRTMCASAAIAGRKAPTVHEDLYVAGFLPGAEHLLTDMRDRIDRAKAVTDAMVRYNEAAALLEEIRQRSVLAGNGYIRGKQWVVVLNAIIGKLGIETQLPDEVVGRWRELKKSAEAIKEHLNRRATTFLRLEPEQESYIVRVNALR